MLVYYWYKHFRSFIYFNHNLYYRYFYSKNFLYFIFAILFLVFLLFNILYFIHLINNIPFLNIFFILQHFLILLILVLRCLYFNYFSLIIEIPYMIFKHLEFYCWNFSFSKIILLLKLTALEFFVLISRGNFFKYCTISSK